MIDCLIATCSAVPLLDPDDRLLLEALRTRGLTAEVGVWNDPAVDWSRARLCLLRATWDYPKHYEDFCAWLDALERVTLVQNSAQLVRWNSHKRYLRDLAESGVPTVPTVWLERGQRIDLAALLTEHGWPQAVVKPAHGAAALNVVRVSQGATAKAQAHLERLLREQDALVQPYLHAVESYPERCLVFIAGAYSHAVSKTQFETTLAIAGSRALLVQPTAAERAVGERAIGAVPGGVPLYARVDLFQSDNGGAVVNELELIEPALYFGAFPAAIATAADAIGRGLDALVRTANGNHRK